MEYLSGIVVLAVFWILYGITGHKWNLWRLVEGADGRSSTSKLQWFLWTVVFIFSYIVIYTARIMKGHFEPIAEIPANVLIAIGFSITTTTAAKAITVSYVSRGRVVKTKVGPKDARWGSIFQDDEGFPDLSKTQMVAWTLIAILVYFIRLVNQVKSELPQLPDIDPALMVLMGLGQGAYLGKKLTTTSVPRLTGLSPSSGKPGTEILIRGLALGNEKSGLLIIDDETFYPDPEPVWQDTQIKFKFPAKHPNGEDWKTGRRVTIRVIVGGTESANTLPFTVTS
jgi:hypothetical protein